MVCFVEIALNLMKNIKKLANKIFIKFSMTFSNKIIRFQKKKKTIIKAQI